MQRQEGKNPFNVCLCGHFLLSPPFNASDCKGVHEATLQHAHEVSSSACAPAGILSHRHSDLSKDRRWRLAAEPGMTASVLEVRHFTHRLPPWRTDISQLLETAYGDFPLYLAQLPVPPHSPVSSICPLPFFWQPFHVSCLIWLGPRPGSLWDS